jgi:hypothetical protein
MSQLFVLGGGVVAPRKLRNYNSTRSSSKDNNNNIAKYSL